MPQKGRVMFMDQSSSVLDISNHENEQQIKIGEMVEIFDILFLFILIIYQCILAANGSPDAVPQDAAQEKARVADAVERERARKQRMQSIPHTQAPTSS